MTREEREDAINCFKNKLENEVFGAKYNKLALEALEQASILDKIRAEIKELDGRYVIGDYGTYGENIPRYVRLRNVLQIIDKYKSESEVEEGNDRA